jgi:hypothetical protein
LPHAQASEPGTRLYFASYNLKSSNCSHAFTCVCGNFLSSVRGTALAPVPLRPMGACLTAVAVHIALFLHLTGVGVGPELPSWPKTGQRPPVLMKQLCGLHLPTLQTACKLRMSPFKPMRYQTIACSHSMGLLPICGFVRARNRLSVRAYG